MATEYYRYRWLVACDDERACYRTRARAREIAAQISGHPANEDVRRFGSYRNADGIVRVIDLDQDTDRVRAGKKNTYVFHQEEECYE
jgi:hypothetical protein